MTVFLEKVGIKGESQHTQSKEHEEVLKALIYFINECLSQDINYDHVATAVRKNTNIRLELGKKRYDIAFRHRKRVVVVQIDSYPYEAEKGAQQNGSS
ncbi:hypothetical protein G4O51_12505 [Candidatus Bathyarchaeota archaeon A05DMB-2]|nr:hypothetical protein [Candidatus Bathyarchaeota archaeon A05DMB-2]